MFWTDPGHTQIWAVTSPHVDALNRLNAHLSSKMPKQLYPIIFLLHPHFIPIIHPIIG